MIMYVTSVHCSTSSAVADIYYAQSLLLLWQLGEVDVRAWNGSICLGIEYR